MRPVWCLIAAGAIACGGGGAGIPEPQVATDDSFPEPPPEPPPVKVDLVADSATLAPGGEIRVAVRFSIRPGWKIYWSNPGEAGLPTVADIDGPEGFAIGELTYPAPHAFDGPGGVRSFGYAKEVLLSAVVRAPDSLEPGADIAISAEASWLACADDCRRGRDRVELTLPVVPGPEAMIATNRELFARHLSRVPEPFDRDACTVTADDNSSTAIVECAGAQALELFPAVDGQAALDGQVTAPTGAGARLSLGFKPGTRPARLRGVVRAEIAGSNHYFRCDEPLSVPRATPSGARAR